ncbi:MAG: segregation/condensation protein A [Candidatus Komeilibacteria bacterium]|jgi:segregation and condensation protein A|nr:segregation/condensation protein A [Candidatus Komeilibacteria bacterium]MBT4447814.1 segregation/condensation protein A [Candidatus Komeilibacteria bacterium]
MHKIQLEQFEGPLDLLLKLIEKNKLQVTEISLAKITDQYLSYIEEGENIASTEVADFLLIASKLIYLKSKYLLPDFNIEDEEDAGSLENQLKIYRQYYEASKLINKQFSDPNKFSYIRANPYKLPTEKGFAPPTNADKDGMSSIFALVISKIARIVNLPKVIIAKAVSISEKIKDLQEVIKTHTKISFNKMFKKKDKTETVVNFLAMLELMKQKEIFVEQEDLFSDLNILRNQK